MASFKKFNYVVSYYSRDEINSTSPTQRKASTFTVETSNATRALRAFKKHPVSKEAVVVAIAPDNEDGKYDVGPVEVQGSSGILS